MNASTNTLNSAAQWLASTWNGRGKILLLTGAGISAESGIPTFRGEEGYWRIGSRNYFPEELATRSAFERMPDEVWGWYLYRRRICRAATPNAAHLAIARLEAGAGGDNKESLDVAALVRDVAELYEPVAEERGIVLKAEPVEPVFVRADRQLLGQAIANLIDNAIKYGAPDRAQGGNGSEPEVSVTTEARGPMAEIVVTDRGPGVPTSERERVLGRFVRLEASRSEPGSGLGLSLVSAVARLHGGSLRLEDNQPGLKVVLSLPADTHALVNGAAHQASGQELRPA